MLSARRAETMRMDLSVKRDFLRLRKIDLAVWCYSEVGRTAPGKQTDIEIGADEQAIIVRFLFVGISSISFGGWFDEYNYIITHKCKKCKTFLCIFQYFCKYFSFSFVILTNAKNLSYLDLQFFSKH